MLGIGEHRFRSVRYQRDPATQAWTRFEPWMTTIVDLDTGQALGVVDGRDHKGVGDRLFAWPLAWRLAVQAVAIDPSAAFRILQAAAPVPCYSPAQYARLPPSPLVRACRYRFPQSGTAPAPRRRRPLRPP
jgi:hypothetical protein